MTRRERDILEVIARGAGGGVLLSKSFFDNSPHDLQTAKDFMWRGLIEAAGHMGDGVRLTPAGRYILDNKQEK